MSSLFDVSALIRTRNLCADRYYDATELPLLVEQELLDRLSILTLEPDDILVLGAVSATTLEQLSTRFSSARITVTDCAEQRLNLLRRHIAPTLLSRVHFKSGPPLASDLGDGSFDLVFSSLYLPLFDDVNALFAALHQMVRSNGCVHFSCLGPDSFAQLYGAWQYADPEQPYHTLIPPDMHDVGDALVHAGFREPVMDRDTYTLTYSTVEALLEDLRNHGVCNGFKARQKGLTGRQLWARFTTYLEQQALDQRIPLTMELVIGQAWRGDGLSQQRQPDGAVGISLEALAHRLRKESGDDAG